MCSGLFTLTSSKQLRIHVITKLYSSNSTASNNLTRTTADDLIDWCTTVIITTRLLSYAAILGVVVLVLHLVMKYLTDSSEDEAEEGTRPSETNPLISRSGKAVTSFTYGACGVRDLESGNYETSSSSGCASEELYDGKLCVICYDEERNCFFVPCGHCATCYLCAKRIFSGESKVCPVCRRGIRRVRKLFAS